MQVTIGFERNTLMVFVLFFILFVGLSGCLNSPPPPVEPGPVEQNGFVQPLPPQPSNGVSDGGESDEDKAVELAKDYVRSLPGFGELNLSVVGVVEGSCPGCFVVDFSSGEEAVKVTIEAWEVVDVLGLELEEEPDTSVVEEASQEQATELAINYVEGMQEFADKGGENLEVVGVVQDDCPGCWTVDFQFDSVSGKETVKVIIEALEVVDVSFS